MKKTCPNLALFCKRDWMVLFEQNVFKGVAGGRVLF